MDNDKIDFDFEFQVTTLDDVASRVLDFFDYIDDVVPFVSEEKKMWLCAIVCGNMEYEQVEDYTVARYDLDDWNMMCLYSDIVEFVDFEIIPDFNIYPERYRQHNIAEFQKFLSGEHEYLVYE
jgi:hypothetical protein